VKDQKGHWQWDAKPSWICIAFGHGHRLVSNLARLRGPRKNSETKSRAGH